MHAMLRKERCVEKDDAYPVIAIVPPALPDVVHITPFEHALDDEARLRIIVQFFKVHIPEDAASQ